MVNPTECQLDPFETEAATGLSSPEPLVEQGTSQQPSNNVGLPLLASQSPHQRQLALRQLRGQHLHARLPVGSMGSASGVCGNHTTASEEVQEKEVR